MEIKYVDASVFLRAARQPGRSDAASRWISRSSALARSRPDAQAYFETFTTDQIASKANNWGKGNIMRWSDPMYDKMFAQYKAELDAGKRKELAEKARRLHRERRHTRADRAAQQRVRLSVGPHQCAVLAVLYGGLERRALGAEEVATSVASVPPRDLGPRCTDHLTLRYRPTNFTKGSTHATTTPISQGLRTLGWLTAMLTIMPLLLTACGGSAATTAPATTAGAAPRRAHRQRRAPRSPPQQWAPLQRQEVLPRLPE